MLRQLRRPYRALEIIPAPFAGSLDTKHNVVGFLLKSNILQSLLEAAKSSHTNSGVKLKNFKVAFKLKPAKLFLRLKRWVSTRVLISL